MGKTEHFMDIATLHKLIWFGHVPRHGGLAKDILQSSERGRHRVGEGEDWWRIGCPMWLRGYIIGMSTTEAIIMVQNGDGPCLRFPHRPKRNWWWPSDHDAWRSPDHDDHPKIMFKCGCNAKFIQIKSSMAVMIVFFPFAIWYNLFTFSVQISWGFLAFADIPVLSGLQIYKSRWTWCYFLLY